MKTTIEFKRDLSLNDNVSIAEMMDATNDKDLLSYLSSMAKYAKFCQEQTKTGQARKNERARKRKAIFGTFDNERLSKKCSNLKDKLKAKKFKTLDKVTATIHYDGRKKSNLYSLIKGVKMFYFTGAISPQYQQLGLKFVNFK